MTCVPFLANTLAATTELKILRNEKNQGIINSLNRGIDLAQGEFIARMDSDDIAMKDRLENSWDSSAAS